MSEYANYVEQSAYEDGLARGMEKSKKYIEELHESHIKIIEGHEKSIAELQAERNEILNFWLQGADPFETRFASELTGRLYDQLGIKEDE